VLRSPYGVLFQEKKYLKETRVLRIIIISRMTKNLRMN
jgi:hypothetical protein